MFGRRVAISGHRFLSRMISAKGKPEAAKIVQKSQVKDTSECKWIGLEKITYKDPNGNERVWDSAVRMTRSTGEIDGIGILAILKFPDGKPDEIVLQKQFRPPVEGVCIEMPAGLIDANEDIDTAALRELREETGYIGKIINKSPVIFNDPGFTNTNLCLVTAEIDMSLPENQNPVTELEENEFIECFSVPLKEFPEKMIELDSQGYKLDARVQNVAQGIILANQFNISQ
ncbi:NUDIX domain [Nakaseomyces glabratus]|nr:ADP-ribose diphosphatase [Nakaseomyces glabratus]